MPHRCICTQPCKSTSIRPRWFYYHHRMRERRVSRPRRYPCKNLARAHGTSGKHKSHLRAGICWLCCIWGRFPLLRAWSLKCSQQSWCRVVLRVSPGGKRTLHWLASGRTMPHRRKRKASWEDWDRRPCSQPPLNTPHSLSFHTGTLCIGSGCRR